MSGREAAAVAVPVDAARRAVGPSRTLLAVTVIGSRAYGLARPGSDVDVRAVYATATEDLLGLAAPVTTIDGAAGCPELDDFVATEVGKSLRLALDANPNVLESWFADTGLAPVHVDPLLAGMWADRGRLLSQRARRTYVGFATSQIARARKALDGDPAGVADGRAAKDVLHCLRVLDCGRRLMATGQMVVAVDDPTDLRRRAARPLEDVIEEFEAARDAIDAGPTPLPAEPDVDRFDRHLRTLRLALLART